MFAVAPSVAGANPLAKPAAAEARSHLALGNKLYGVRSFEEAAAEYKAGALVEAAPVFDYNLGQCYRLTGKYQEAIWHYERFLTRGKPEGEILDAVNDFIAQMKSELDKKAMTQKPTDPAPVGALVSSQGLQVPIPAHTTEMSAQVPEPWYDDYFGWGLAGAGVVGLGVGGGFLINAESLRNEESGNPSQQEQKRLQDMANARNLLGTVIGIGGTGLLVTGIIKLAIHTKRPSHSIGLRVVPSTNGVMVFGQF